MTKTAASRIIVALDKPNYAGNLFLLRTLAPLGLRFKVGLAMLPLLSQHEIEAMTAIGGGLFLDFKLHDIPQTVTGAVKNICALNPAFLTVHAEIPVMHAAVQGKGDHAMRLLAVAVLTNLDDADLARAGYPFGVNDLMYKKALFAKEAGMDGMICSAKELTMLRKTLGDQMCLITPGIRPEGAVKGDQKRVMTPRQAIQEGVDYMVIGRPIVAAEQPVKAAEAIIQEVDRALG